MTAHDPSARVPTHDAPIALLIEDDSTLRDVLAYNLARIGYEVSEADDGYAGIAAARAAGHRLDVVVLDRMLPGIDGLGVVRHLRADPSTTGAFVVMMSAHVEDEFRASALAAGADDVLAKPFALDDLLGRLRRTV